jgi:hypothetical protein
MKIASISARVFLPIPLAVGVSIIIGVLASYTGGVKLEAPAVDAGASNVLIDLWGVLCILMMLQVAIGAPSIAFLRGRPLWLYVVSAACLTCVLGSFGGTLGLFGFSETDHVGSDRILKRLPKVTFRDMTGMLAIAGPAMIISYSVLWWRFTIVPSVNRRKRKRRTTDVRTPNQEIGKKTSLPVGPKTVIPEENIKVALVDRMTTPKWRGRGSPRKRKRSRRREPPTDETGR